MRISNDGMTGMQTVVARRRSVVVPTGLLRGSRFLLDLASNKQLFVGLWEREVLGWIRRLSKTAHTAIDVGAGQGEYTLFFARLAVMTRVVAVEPGQEALSRLLSNLRLNGIESGGRVEIVTAAAGAADHGVTRRLDSIVPEPTLPLVIKVDVEGSEADVLAGATRLLRLPDVRLLLETHSADLEAQCASLLAGLGFNTRVVRQAWWRALVPERRQLSHNQWLVAWKKPLA